MIRWSGPALILWAVHLLVKDSIFAFTHGSSQAAMAGTFLGLDASQYSVIWTPFPLLAAAGLSGLRAMVSTRLGRLGNVGLAVAIGAFVLTFLAGVMQFWILDVDAHFYSPLVFGGWLLSILAFLAAAVGLVLAGVDIRRRRTITTGSSTLLIIGLVALPMLFLRFLLVANSDDTLPWRLAYIGLIVPWAIGWARLGSTLATSNASGRPAA